MICGRGAGKTYAASLLCAISALSGDRILVGAQNYKSLSINLFAEITKRLDEIIGFNNYHYNRGQTIIEIPMSKGIIYGFTYENIDSCRGYTEINKLVLDESALSPATVLETVGPCCRGTGKDPQYFFLTTPKAGSWFNLFVKNKMEKDPNSIDVIKARSTDNKFISKIEYEMMLGGFTNETLIRQELEGEMLSEQAENSVLAGVYYHKGHDPMPLEGYVNIGIDASGFGKDKSVITYRIGNYWMQKSYATLNGQDCRLEIKRMLQLNPGWKVNGICIDMAYGESLYENLCQEYEGVDLINFASKPVDDQYANIRAEMYFDLVRKIREGMKITDDIEKELNVTLFEFNNSGKLKLVSKDEIKLVLGHSPDQSDSLALTFAIGDKVYEKGKETIGTTQEYYCDPED